MAWRLNQHGEQELEKSTPGEGTVGVEETGQHDLGLSAELKEKEQKRKKCRGVREPQGEWWECSGGWGWGWGRLCSVSGRMLLAMVRC